MGLDSAPHRATRGERHCRWTWLLRMRAPSTARMHWGGQSFNRSNWHFFGIFLAFFSSFETSNYTFLTFNLALIAAVLVTSIISMMEEVTLQMSIDEHGGGQAGHLRILRIGWNTSWELKIIMPLRVTWNDINHLKKQRIQPDVSRLDSFWFAKFDWLKPNHSIFVLHLQIFHDDSTFKTCIYHDLWGFTRRNSWFCGTTSSHLPLSQAHDQCTPEACECGNSRTHVQLACWQVYLHKNEGFKLSNQSWLILLLQLGNMKINMT